MPLSFEKPLGTRDLLPVRVLQNKKVIGQAQDFIKTWGYEEIETPIIEYFQTVGLYSQISEEKFIKFLDTSGSTVVLRPDLTTPMARFASSVYGDVELPLRLTYTGSVYRTKGNAGLEEIKQLDVELIGAKDLTGDAEVITLAIKTILNYPITGVRAAVGHTQFLQVLLTEIGCPHKECKKLFNSLLERDFVGFRETLEILEIPQEYKNYLNQVLKLKGNLANVLIAKNWFNTPLWNDIFAQLEDLDQILVEYGISPYINYDLTLVGSQNYYTGLIYNIYCVGHPYPICSGGRYDNLLASFDRPAPATGFAINLDDLIKVININDLKFEQRKILIVYNSLRRLEAINKATELRKSGEIVVIAEQNTVSSSFIQGFTETISLE